MAPLRAPNALIYAQAVFSPSRLIPDLYAPSISHIDWKSLRKEGFNAVVIDKDNCLTWPHKDSLHPSIKQGWKQLKETFGNGRVLVVSNSAGTRRDLGGIAAESVSRKLGVPVLIHRQPKPGCAPEIIQYFQGQLPLHTVSGAAGSSSTSGKQVLSTEEDRELGEAVEAEMAGGEWSGKGLLGRQIGKTGMQKKSDKGKEKAANQEQAECEEREDLVEPLKILVIGDRLATDVLLSHRLQKYLHHQRKSLLKSSSGDNKRNLARNLEDRIDTISIVTTSLFKYRDVRLLRLLENKWAGLRDTEDERRKRELEWGRYLLKEDRILDRLPAVVVEPSLLGRISAVFKAIGRGIRRVGRWRIPTWREVGLALRGALFGGIRKGGSLAWRGVRSGVDMVGSRIRGTSRMAVRSRGFSTASALARRGVMQQRRSFGTVGLRLNARVAPIEAGIVFQPHRNAVQQMRYEQFPDDETYSEFSASLDRIPMSPSAVIGRSSMVDHLEALSDQDIVQVLESVLGIREENRNMRGSDMGIISIALSMRSRSSYGDILAAIPARTMTSMLSMLLDMGSTHLAHMFLHDLTLHPIADEVKLAILRQCAEITKGRNVDHSYISRLAVSIEDNRLGILTPGQKVSSALTLRDEISAERLAVLLQGYNAEKGYLRTDSTRIYNTLFSYVATTLAALQGYEPEEALKASRFAKWVSYQTVLTLVRRESVELAERGYDLLSRAGWAGSLPNLVVENDMEGEVTVESRYLAVRMGIMRGCIDLTWIDRAYGIAKDIINSNLVGPATVAVWQNTFEDLIKLSVASQHSQRVLQAMEFLLTSGFERTGITLSTPVLDGLYELLHGNNIWRVYRKFRVLGYPPPKDDALLHLATYVYSRHRSASAVEALLKDVAARPDRVSAVHMARFVVKLAQSRSPESARKWYQSALAAGGDWMKKLANNPYVVYALVKIFGGPQTRWNQRSHDRDFANQVIRVFMAASPSLNTLAPTSIVLLARCFILVEAPASAKKLFEYACKSDAANIDGSLDRLERAAFRNRLVAELLEGDAEATATFLDVVRANMIESHFTSAQLAELSETVDRRPE